jgi:hypothetical protein
MITKTEYKIISPKGKEINKDDIEIEVTETKVEKRRVTPGALKQAIDMLKNNKIRYNKDIKRMEEDIKINQDELSSIIKKIDKEINYEKSKK